MLHIGYTITNHPCTYYLYITDCCKVFGCLAPLWLWQNFSVIQTGLTRPSNRNYKHTKLETTHTLFAWMQVFTFCWPSVSLMATIGGKKQFKTVNIKAPYNHSRYETIWPNNLQIISSVKVSVMQEGQPDSQLLNQTASWPARQTQLIT